ncbi:RNA polymerase sigma factor [Paenibacillus terrigena]|uniref:RNA polymerase sigma factor n=1 Tax=Paenibacillus terrigena TaxID=369333 RepID=UPI00037DDADA|nr:RNA polymerase sigma factor [Paenibacillus terrigena]
MVYIEPMQVEKVSQQDRVDQLQIVLRRYCLSITNSLDDADDLVQDTWVKALSASPGLTHLNPEALLLRIAKNTWIDQMRRRTHLNRIMEQLQLEPILYPDHGRLEVEAAFHHLMTHLSPRQRTVFLLRDVLGYSISEASQIMMTSEGAVKAALHRARQTLADIKEEKKIDSAVTEDHIAKEQIERLASTYLDGDIGTLIQLIQKNNMESVAMIGLIQNKMMQRSSTVQAGRSKSHTSMMMAA